MIEFFLLQLNKKVIDILKPPEGRSELERG